MNMEMGFFQGGVPGLVVQGLLWEVKEAENDRDGKVFNISVMVSETMIRSGVEMQSIETRIFKVKDLSLFSSYLSLVGSVVSFPVGYMKTKDGGVFFIPKASFPKKIKLESQPPAMPKAA